MSETTKNENIDEAGIKAIKEKVLEGVEFLPEKDKNKENGEEEKKAKIAKFEKIIDNVVKTPTGRKTLEALSKQKFFFSFQKGEYDLGSHCIEIDPDAPDEYMAALFIRESQSIFQESMRPADAPMFDKSLKTAFYLKKARAMAADAGAHEMAFVYECKDVLPEVYREAERQNSPMFRAYVSEMEKSGDEKKAMRASFEAWFEDEHSRNYYDVRHKKNIEYWCDKKRDCCFCEEYKTEDILKMCCHNGEQYVSADFLDKGIVNSITKADRMEIAGMLIQYVGSVQDAKADDSVFFMELRDKDGNLLSRQAEKEDDKTKETKGILQRIFETSNHEKNALEEQVLKKFIDGVMKTPKGRETLEAFSKLGYTFTFEYMKGCYGACNSDSKKIKINPKTLADHTFATLVHECRHAIQHSLESENVPKDWYMQVAAFLKKGRAMEADACAHEMAFVYECKNVLPDVYRDTEQRNLPMFRAYVSEMEKSGDERKAMEASFKAWFDYDEYREGYEDDYKKYIEKSCDWGISGKDPKYFSKEYKTEDILKMCRYNGEQYISVDFMDNGIANSVTAEHQAQIVSAIRHYVEKVPGAVADTSVEKMELRDKQGNLLTSEMVKLRENVLQSFRASSDEKKNAECGRFEQMVDTVIKTPKGRETLDALLKLGYTFTSDENVRGEAECLHDSKKIALHPIFMNWSMAPTFVREAQRAVQNSLKPENAPADEHMQTASYLKKERAMAADAKAHEMAFIYECKDVAPEVYRVAKTMASPSFCAYVSEMENSGDKRKAMEASFKAYFEDRSAIRTQEFNLVIRIEDFCKDGIARQDAKYFSEEYKTEDILKMCRYNGEQYVSADVLDKGTANSVMPVFKKDIVRAVERFAKGVPGAAADASVEKMALRDKEGNLTSLPEKDKKDFEEHFVPAETRHFQKEGENNRPESFFSHFKRQVEKAKSSPKAVDVMRLKQQSKGKN